MLDMPGTDDVCPELHNNDTRNEPLPPFTATMQLNETWRIRSDGIQWRLQKRRGRPAGNYSGWSSQRFHAEARCLRKTVADICGEISDLSKAWLSSLPKFHPTLIRRQAEE